MWIVHRIGIRKSKTVCRGNEGGDALPIGRSEVRADLEVVGRVRHDLIDHEDKRSARGEMPARKRARRGVVIRRKVLNDDVGDRRCVERHRVRRAFIFEFGLKRLNFRGTETDAVVGQSQLAKERSARDVNDPARDGIRNVNVGVEIHRHGRGVFMLIHQMRRKI